MPDNNKIKAFYDIAKSKNVPLPDYDTFVTALSDPNKRKAFYDVAKTNDVPLPDYQTYDSILGGREQPTTLSKKPSSFVEQRFPFAIQGIRQAQEGNPVAGGINLANQVVAEGFRPFTIADEFLRNTRVINPRVFPAGRAASNLMRAIPEGISGLYDLGKRGINATGVPELLDRSVDAYARMRGSIPMSDEQKREIAQAGDVMNKNIAMFTMPEPILRGATKAISKTADYTVNKINSIANKMDTPKSVAAKQEAVQGIRKVIPPSTAASKANQAKNLDRSIDRSLGYINDKLKTTKYEGEVPYVEHAGKVINEAYHEAYNQSKNVAYENPDVTIDLKKPVLDAVENSLTSEFKKSNPARYKKIKEYVEGKLDEKTGKYEGGLYSEPLTLPEVFDNIERLNKENRPFFGKNPSEQSVANADYDLAGVDRIALEAVREKFFDKLEELGYEGVKDLRKDVGALSTLNKAFFEKSEKNRQLDARSPFKRGFQDNPIHNALVMGMIGKMANINPKLRTAVELIAGSSTVLGNINRKPSNVIRNAFNQLEKTGIEKPKYDLTRKTIPNIGEATKGLPPLETKPPTEGEGGIPVAPELVKPITPRGIVETPKIDYAKEAKAVGVRFDGFQDFQGKKIPQFTDSQTGTTFYGKEGEPLSETVARKREQFKETKPTELPEITKPVLKEDLPPAIIKKMQSILDEHGTNIKVTTPEGKILSKDEVAKAIDDWGKDNGTEKSKRAQALINALIEGYQTGKVQTK